jgi:hypothetical protein
MSSTAIEYLYNNGGTEYLPFFSLASIQVEEISQDFKKSIIEIQSITDGEIYEENMDEYDSNILVSLYIQQIMREETLWMSFVKDKSKMKYESIYEILDEVGDNDAFKEEDVYSGTNERTHGADVCSSSLRYMLSCIDDSLPQIIYDETVSFLVKIIRSILLYKEGKDCGIEIMTWSDKPL